MKKDTLKIIISLISIIIFLLLAFGSGDSEKDSVVDLNGKISFTGTQFVLTNNDTFDWINVELKLNDTYLLKTDVIKAGTIYTVGALQFAKEDGTRFNPFNMKVQKFAVWCKTPDGRYGAYYGQWE